MYDALSMLYLRLKAEEGSDLAEYALILALVAVVAITALTGLGGNITAKLNKVAGTLGGGS